MDAHNQLVTSTRWRVFVALVLAHALPIAASLPAEHVHVADEGRPSSIAHRHAAPHHDDGDDHHEELALSHGDDHVAWIPDVFLDEKISSTAYPLAAISHVQAVDPEIARTTTWRPVISGQPHGPPRPSLKDRAPPILPV